MSKEYYEKYPELPKKLVDDVLSAIPDKTPKPKITKIFEEVLKEYEDSLIDGSESVGIIAAQSIGEPGTQMTLDTKHQAGVAELNVTTGLPRLIEVLDGRKTIKTPQMEIYFKPKFNNLEFAKEFAIRIKETVLSEIANEFVTDIANNSVEVIIDMQKLKFENIDMETIKTSVSKNFRSKTIEIVREDTLRITLKPKADIVKDLYETKEKLKHIRIKGINGITQVLPVQRKDDFVIITAGVNMKDILQLEEVDVNRLYANDIFEVYKTLGIEAARALIVKEISNVMNEQGIALDVRHTLLIADTMCMSGSVKGITRYGIISEKSSVLARASFETTLKHLIEASLIGEIDPLNSVIENVLLNQEILQGTGSTKLYLKEE